MPLEAPHPVPDDGVVRLRPWTQQDLHAVRAASDEGRIPESTTVPEEFTEAAGRAFVERQRARQEQDEGWSLVIADATSDEALGSIALLLRPQPGVAGIGYWLVPQARGRGLAARAVQLLTTWALGTHGLQRVEAWVEPANTASVRVLEHCRFSYEGRLRSFLTLGGRRADASVFSRIAADERVAGPDERR